MTKRTKRLLFYSALAVFFILSYVIILYAQGYKYSFSEGLFQRTGAIVLKTNTDGKVFLNDKLEGSTSFFGHTFNIDRLLPGKYWLTIQKNDYASWTKTVIVEQGLVIDFPNVLLLPEEGEEEQKLFDEVDLLFEEYKSASSSFFLDKKGQILYQTVDQEQKKIAESVKGFRISANKNKIAWWTVNELWIMWLDDQNYQPFHKKDDKDLITRFLSPIQNGSWFRGEDHLILELETRDSKNRPYSIYKIIEIDKRGGVNIVEL